MGKTWENNLSIAATVKTWLKNGLSLRECAECGNTQNKPFLGNYFEPESYQTFEWFIVIKAGVIVPNIWVNVPNHQPE